MKKTLILLSFLCSLSVVLAQPLKLPAPSPLQTIRQDFSLSYLEIAYSRPSMRSRSIFGDVVPFGELWRTGANVATKITFGEDVKVAGNALKAGSYALYTIPNKAEWEIIFNKGITNGGTDGYKTEEDVLRFKVKPNTLTMPVETFTMQLSNITGNSCQLELMWDKTALSLPITADNEGKIVGSIEKTLAQDNRPYYQAANYYFDNGKDLEKARTWVDKALEQNPKAYWVMHLKAKIQAKAGDKKGANESARQSLEMARAEKDANYIRLNEKLMASLK